MPREAVVSEYTALSCLKLLSAHYAIRTDVQPTSETVRTEGGSLTICRLIELADDLGFTVRYFLGDWHWLQMEVSFHPTLLVLKNTNVVLAIAHANRGTEGIVIRDPLHRDAETIVLAREDVERAWDGDLLLVTPRPEQSETSNAEYEVEGSDTSDCSAQPSAEESGLDFASRVPSRIGRVVVLSCLASITLLAGLLFAAFTGTASKWAPEIVSQLASSPEGPATPLSSDMPHPIAPADQMVENVPERPSSSTMTPRSETPAKTSAVGESSSSPETSKALDTRQSPVLPSPGETPPEKPSVAEAQLTDARSNVASVNQTSSGGTPLPEAPPTTSATGMQRTDPESATARPQEAKRNQLSSTPTFEREEGAALLARGDDYLRMEDIVSARLFYERAADAGWANAALRLGETFDPVFLSRAQMHGLAGDMEKAMFWYRRARELGSTEAGMLLKQLDAN